MEQMNNEQTIYNAALYCRLSKDDEQAGYYTEVYCPLYKSIEFYDDFVA